MLLHVRLTLYLGDLLTALTLRERALLLHLCYLLIGTRHHLLTRIVA